MNRELTAAARDERLYAEMVAILRELAGVNDADYCPYCGWDNYHIDSCPVTRARCLIAALDTPEERRERYLDGYKWEQ